MSSPSATTATTATTAEVESTTDDSTARFVAARSSVIESIRGCGLAGVRIDKDDLRKKVLIPNYLRQAICLAIRTKDPSAVASQTAPSAHEATPEGPVIVFVNSRSGGRHGPELKIRLQQLMSDEQVFDLSDVKPREFVQYGLRCLENLASRGDFCAKEIREKLRILVGGGDGTVGWILGSLTELYNEGREPIPPVAIIPLGTGNDLSRSFGWGGSFPFAWKLASKRILLKAITNPVCRLDSWHVMVTMPSGELVDPPHSLKCTDEIPADQGLAVAGKLPEKSNSYEGVFYNYFSIGMDAQVAYGFHHLRNEKPYLAQGPIANKVWMDMFPSLIRAYCLMSPRNQIWLNQSTIFQSACSSLFDTVNQLCLCECLLKLHILPIRNKFLVLSRLIKDNGTTIGRD